MKITKETLKTLRSEIDSALDALGKKHGVKFQAGNVAFDDAVADFKLRVSVISDGVVARRETHDFIRYAEIIGFKASDLNRIFKTGGKTLSLIGYSARRTSRPMLCVDLETGKEYLFSVDAVREGLKS